MTASPLQLDPLFMIGPVTITDSVIVTWAIMLLVAIAARLMVRRLALRPGRTQAVHELVTNAIDGQITDVMQADPSP